MKVSGKADADTKNNAPGAKALDLGELAEKFRPLVRGIARRYANNPADREDLEQEGYLALIKIARGAKRGDMALLLKNHLPGYVRDAARKLWRHEGAVAPLSGGDGDWREWLLADARSEEDVLTLELEDELERLLPPDLLAVARALWDGMTQAEIAAAAGTSRAAVVRRIEKIRRLLRREG